MAALRHTLGVHMYVRLTHTRTWSPVLSTPRHTVGLNMPPRKRAKKVAGKPMDVEGDLWPPNDWRQTDLPAGVSAGDMNAVFQACFLQKDGVTLEFEFTVPEIQNNLALPIYRDSKTDDFSAAPLIRGNAACSTFEESFKQSRFQMDQHILIVPDLTPTDIDSIKSDREGFLQKFAADLSAEAFRKKVISLYPPLSLSLSLPLSLPLCLYVSMWTV